MMYKAGLLLLCVPLLLSTATVAHADDTGQPQPSVLVKTITLKPRKLTDTIIAYGRVEPDPAAVQGISVAHSGRVEALLVAVGQTVDAGQALLKLAASPQARLAYSQATAQLEYAKQNLAHVKALYAQQLATNDELAAAKKQLATAKAELAAAKAQGSDQSAAVIRAPFHGVVGAIKVSPGDRVAADTVLLTLFNPARLRVPLGVSPTDLARLKPGLPVTLAPVFDDSLNVAAHLDQLQAIVNPNTHLMDALVALKGEQADGLKPGMWVRGLIAVREASELAVPRQAVLRDTRGSYIFVITHNKARQVYVQTDFAGSAAGSWIGVRATGLQPGDTVVVLGNYELHDGMTVREQAAQ
ncbi:MAG TPA: efflux RND transporter periplasmic adaptor subunit [Gammaproteobacteria bacterium]|nr:efflux RND transporter periplasmic adaptor subunit [Gammaproteobacteria bacterium]